MKSYIIIPAEHFDLVDIRPTPYLELGPILILEGEHEGSYAISVDYVNQPEFAELTDILNAEPLTSVKIVAELPDSALDTISVDE